MFNKIIIWLAAALFFSSSASADVLFNSGYPGTVAPGYYGYSIAGNSVYANQFALTDGNSDPIFSGTQGTGCTFNDIKFVATGTTYSGSISYYIYSDSVGSIGLDLSSPASILASGTIGATPTNFGPIGFVPDQNMYLFDLIIPSFTAEPDVPYWIGLHDGPTDAASESDLVWAEGSDVPSRVDDVIGPLAAIKGLEDCTWSDSPFSSSFRLEYIEVPEPPTAGILMFAMIFLLLVPTLKRNSRSLKRA